MQQTTIKHQTSNMPSFFKHSNGIHKPRFTPHKPGLRAIPCTTSCATSGSTFLNTSFLNTSFFNTTFFNTSVFTSVFDSQDCIWYYGTLYVKEATAVAKLNERVPVTSDPVTSDPVNSDPVNSEPVNSDPVTSDPVNSDPVNSDLIQDNQSNPSFDDNDDDVDAESVSSIGKRNVGKQNQLKYLKDGMQLRHFFHDLDYWHAVFDADTNRIIRTPDGVAFDTLRQFARLHCNEVLGMTPTLGNVWTNPNFQYKDKDDDLWHPLSSLKK